MLSYQYIVNYKLIKVKLWGILRNKMMIKTTYHV